MQVVIRNFIKLLSTGAFQSYCTLEEMSEYKWNQLLYIAKINDVEDFIISGIIYSDNSSNNIIPTKITNSINETIYSNTTRITPKDVFHFGEIAIPDLKKYLREEGINVRI